MGLKDFAKEKLCPLRKVLRITILKIEMRLISQECAKVTDTQSVLASVKGRFFPVFNISMIRDISFHKI